MKKQLASTLHQLITDALVDLESAKNNPDVKINMTSWFDKRTPTNRCSVCFAGAVMIGRMGLALDSSDLDEDLDFFSEVERHK